MLRALKKFQRWVLLTIALLSIFFYIFILSRTPFFVSARLKTIDTLYALRAAHSEPLSHFKDVVVIGVDDESYRKMDLAWPWGREVFAVFLRHLQELRPKVVALDFSFVGKSSDPETDAHLAASLSITKNVILTAYFDPSGRFMSPLGIFKKAAKGCGFIDKPLDRDLVNRRVNPIVVLEKGKAYSLGVETACASLDLSPESTARVENDQLLIHGVNVPLDAQSQMWVSYRYKPADFAYVPFWKIYDGKADISEIKGKTVIVGPTSALFHDMSATPLGTMAGVFANANEALCYLDADFIGEVFQGWEWLFLVILTAVFIFLFYHLKHFSGFAVLLCLEGMIYWVAFVLFSKLNLIFEPFSPMLILLLAYVLSIFSRSLANFLENQELRQQVVMDDLTGIYGHRYLTIRLAAEFRRAAETKKELCFSMIDIDLFKKVNDTYGHEHGNTVLITVAKILKTSLRGYDVVARYGGEEFSVIFQDSPQTGAVNTMDRIRKAVEAHQFWTPSGSMSVTISSGICSNNHPDVRSKDDLIRFADQTLYRAKSGGRNQVCVYASAQPLDRLPKQP